MSDSKWRPGQSGNPAGKKPGTKNRKTLLMEELERDGSALAAAIKAKALEGDASCMSLWLSRLEPPARTRGETVEIEFDSSKSVADQLLQVASAVARGELTLDQGKQFSEILQRVASARALNQGGDHQAEMIQAMRDLARTLPV